MNKTNRIGPIGKGLGSKSAPQLSWLSTPLRCHIACGFLAAGLIAIVSAIWIHPEILAADRSHSPQQLEDAIELISGRNRLQNRFDQAMDRRRQVRQRVNQIARWLPQHRSWENVRSILQNVAADCDVQLIALDRGTSHAGKRVTVLDTQCEIQGSYANLCRFLNQIAAADLPIWCDEIRVVRGDDSHRFSLVTPGRHAPVHCLATVSLRIPYAGKDTTAAKLLKQRNDHET